MRATLNVTRAATGATAVAAQKYAEDTIDILRYLILSTYLAGLILPIPIGWIGEELDALFPSNGFTYLGYLPGAIAFIAVSFFWWDFEARALAAEAFIQGLPESFRKRALKWSMKEGFTYKFFYDNSMVGLWMPILLWVPAEFPVWWHPIHYVGALAVTMAVTQLVATRKDAPPVWRRRYMVVVGLFGLRHLAGFMGYDFGSEMFTGISVDNTQDWVMGHFILTLIVLGAITLLWPSGKAATTTGGGHA